MSHGPALGNVLLYWVAFQKMALAKAAIQMMGFSDGFSESELAASAE